jgi:hypothetical protein
LQADVETTGLSACLRPDLDAAGFPGTQQLYDARTLRGRLRMSQVEDGRIVVSVWLLVSGQKAPLRTL